MALLEQTLFGKINKVEASIQRIKLAELSEEPLYVCYSGGKDSKVIRRLCEMAGVRYELHYSLTTVDHPSVVRELMDDPNIIIDKSRDNEGKQITMWSLIVQKKLPPTRLVRYCCAELKENGGKGRICVTGVRKAESINRSKNGGEAKIIGKSAKKLAFDLGADYTDTPKGGIVLNLDNANSRRVVEQCYRTQKTLINPIIDWADDDVWEFSRTENIKQSDLYIENGGRYKRLGCILCPMASSKERANEAIDYPRIKEAYINTFDRMLKFNSDIDYSWNSGEEVYDWWLEAKIKKKVPDNQFALDL